MEETPVVLVGLMGSGKTTVARILARALGRPVRDSDDDLEATYGINAAEQVERYGRAVLHERERRMLREAVAAPEPAVIAAAASVVDQPAGRDALTGAFVVWLDAPPRVLAERMRDGDHRPHYDPDLEKMLADQHKQRAGWFRALADLVVEVSDAPPEQVVEIILTALELGGTAGRYSQV